MDNNKEYLETQIDFHHIFTTLWRRKYWIVAINIFVLILVTVYVSRMNNIYVSQSMLKPQDNGGNTSSNQNISSLASMAGVDLKSSGVTTSDILNTIANDPQFLCDFVKRYNYESKVIDGYDSLKNKKDFKNHVNFFIKKSLISDFSFSINNKTGIITVTYQNRDRAFCAVFINSLLKDLSNHFKYIDTNNLDQQIKQYKLEINSTPDIVLKNKLSDVVATLIQNKVINFSHKYYGFEILVPSSVHDEYDFVSPNRKLIVFMFTITSLILSSVFFIIIDKNK